MTWKKEYFNLFVILAAMLVFMALPGTMQAWAEDQSQYVTSLEVSPAVVETNGKVRIEVSFSDGGPDEHVFHGGDTINVEWPISGEAYLKGYAKTIPLVNPDGITYASVSITSQGAVLTFNDAVNELYDVYGSFYFEALARNATETDEQDEKVVTVTAGSKTADVTIVKPASGSGVPGELPDFRKQADDIGGGWTHIEGIEGWVMTLDPDDPTYTRWVLTANENREGTASDIVIRDELGRGQAIDPSWAQLYSGGDLNKFYEGTLDEVIAAFESDFPESSLTFDDDGNISWIIDKTAANHESWCLTYRCDITDFSLLTFENSATISGTAEDGTTYTDSDESQFANVDEGGGVNVLPRGVLRVIKKVRGTDLTVAGVVFKLEKQNGETWEDAGTLTTDSDGSATKTKLKTGHYRIYEISVPDHLVKEYTEENPYEFDIDTSITELQSLELTVEDSVVRMDVTAKKIWKNSDGTSDDSLHPVIYFRLYRAGANGVPKAYGEIKALENGVTEVTWEDLPKYDVHGNAFTYSVKEVDEEGNDLTPEGYTKDESGLNVTNTGKPEDEPPVPDNPEPPKPVDTEVPQEAEVTESPPQADEPDTGDGTDIRSWLLLMGLAGISFAGIAAGRFRRR